MRSFEALLWRKDGRAEPKLEMTRKSRRGLALPLAKDESAGSLSAPPLKTHEKRELNAPLGQMTSAGAPFAAKRQSLQQRNRSSWQ
jgi:hypothetical protein